MPAISTHDMNFHVTDRNSWTILIGFKVKILGRDRNFDRELMSGRGVRLFVI